MNWTHVFEQIAAAAIFGGAGIVLLLGGFWLVTKISPFSVRKEIETDHNTAFAVLLGSAMIGIAIIVAAAIRG